MKKLLAIICLTAFTVVAGTHWISLAWDPNPEGQAKGFILYAGTSSGGYTMSTNVGYCTNFTWGGFDARKTYYFACTSYDTNGVESDFSNEITNTFKATGPKLRETAEK